MAEGNEARTLSIFIDRDPATVYAFVSNPENLPKWATTFCKSVEKSNGEWIIDTPQGRTQIRIVAKNDFGVLDHYVSQGPGVEVYVPMRVVPNGGGSEVLFTLFRLPGMTRERYAEDAALVERDLGTLKRVLEQ